MGEERRGIHRVLEFARVYSSLQRAISRPGSADSVREKLYPELGTGTVRVLDIGCGPAAFWARYQDVGNIEYVGIEPNPRYVKDTRERFPDVTIHAGTVTDVADAALGPFDLVVLEGVLHHLDDSAARQAIAFGAERLRPAGRLVALDPVFLDQQSPIARTLARLDRGKHVRSLQGYRDLAVGPFVSDAVTVRRMSGQLRIPYDHAYLEAKATSASP